jgi:hypothetical protein
MLLRAMSFFAELSLKVELLAPFMQKQQVSNAIELLSDDVTISSSTYINVEEINFDSGRLSLSAAAISIT